MQVKLNNSLCKCHKEAKFGTSARIESTRQPYCGLLHIVRKRKFKNWSGCTTSSFTNAQLVKAFSCLLCEKLSIRVVPRMLWLLLLEKEMQCWIHHDKVGGKYSRQKTKTAEECVAAMEEMGEKLQYRPEDKFSSTNWSRLVDCGGLCFRSG